MFVIVAERSRTSEISEESGHRKEDEGDGRDPVEKYEYRPPDGAQPTHTGDLQDLPEVMVASSKVSFIQFYTKSGVNGG